jgi:hypothetical protein
MAQTREMENAYQIFVGKVEAKRPLWRPRQKDNINMHLKETDRTDMDLEQFKKNTSNSVITTVRRNVQIGNASIYTITQKISFPPSPK